MKRLFAAPPRDLAMGFCLCVCGFAAQAQDHVLIAWNDLGIHCANQDFSELTECAWSEGGPRFIPLFQNRFNRRWDVNELAIGLMRLASTSCPTPLSQIRLAESAMESCDALLALRATMICLSKILR